MPRVSATDSVVEDYVAKLTEELALENLALKREVLQGVLAVPEWTPSAKVLRPPLFAERCIIPVLAERSKSPVKKVLTTDNTEKLQQKAPAAPHVSHRPKDAVKSKSSEKEEKKKPRPQTVRWEVSASFPSKLFTMLEEADQAGHSDIISFLPDGRAFKIHKPDEFAQTVLPKYCKTNRLASFKKQLSLYGFKTIQFGADFGAIRHESFQRDDKKQIAKIQRRRQLVPGGETKDQKKERVAVWRALRGTCRKQHD